MRLLMGTIQQRRDIYDARRNNCRRQETGHRQRLGLGYKNKTKQNIKPSGHPFPKKGRPRPG